MSSLPSPGSPAHPPYNRLGLDYHRPPAHRVALPDGRRGGGLIDAHIHTRGLDLTREFLTAARAYGFTQFWTQSPLEDVELLRAEFPDTFHFIATPSWQKGAPTQEFLDDWLHRLDAFWEKGARFFKLHMAPGTKQRWQMDLRHPNIRKVIEHAYALGYNFMAHIADPQAWFAPGGRYADTAVFGTFAAQFEPLEELLAAYPDRLHWGAHFGGSIEDLPALARRLDRFPNYFLDCSATKWIVRAVAEHLQAQKGEGGGEKGELGEHDIRGFLLKYQDRVLFGSDLVIADKLVFDHYASRYWAHQMLWETAHRGESPIEDPDAADGRPLLYGVDLPEEVLTKWYGSNARRWAAAGG